MRRIGEFDLPDRLLPGIPAWATQIAVGIGCAIVAVLIRVVFDTFAPGSAPFALVYPVIILATLLARWPAGALAAALSILYAWRFT